MRRASILLCGLLSFGCDDASNAQSDQSGVDYTDEMPEDLPAGGCRDEDCEEGGSSGGVDAAPSASEQEAAPCRASDECSGAGACVATFQDGSRGGFECRFACVPSLDESSWCGDDASCCDPAAVCTDRGYCVVVPSPTRTGSGKTEGNGPKLSDQMPDDLPAGDGVPDDLAAGD